MLAKLFITHLHILQLEGYEPLRFLSWWIKHPTTTQPTQKKPLVYTSKVKTLIYLSAITATCLFLGLLLINPSLSLIPIIILIFLPFIYLFISLLLLKPYEIINKHLTINRTRKTLANHPTLTTIGITGSYGKTSTKDILFNILNSYQPSLKTPESYNTIFGIAKTVSLELLTKTKYFICEMAAYHRGEIKQLCYQVPPQYAILTGIGPQHLERFGSLKNTTLAKFELVDSVNHSHALANLDNEHISKQLKLPAYKSVKTFSLYNKSATFFISKQQLSKKGISFTLRYKNKSYAFTSPLFGTANLYNLTAAISMALMLKVKPLVIQSAVSKLKPSPHRLQLLTINRATIIDNAFSSNTNGFQLLIEDLKKIKGKKALITPGIIELGSATNSIHLKLGEQAKGVFNSIYLIGKSDRTINFEKGVNQPVSYLPNDTKLAPLIDKLSANHDWIIIENDLPDNY